MGEWRFDGAAGRPAPWAVVYFVASLAFAAMASMFLADVIG
jgi:hypothetical protein